MSKTQTTQEALNTFQKELEVWKAAALAAEAERDALAATLSEIQQASQDYSDGKITRYEFVKKLAFLAAVQPQQHIAKIRAEAVLMFAQALASLFPHGMSGGDVFAQADRLALHIRQGGDV